MSTVNIFEECKIGNKCVSVASTTAAGGLGVAVGPQWGAGAKPLAGGQGAEPLEALAIWASDRTKNTNLLHHF